VQNVQFLDVLNSMIAPNEFKQLCEEYAPRARSAPRMSAEQVVSGFIYHQLQDRGTLAKNCQRLHGISMSDSAHSQRRQSLPVELFEQLLSSALQPLADASRHPECFYGGYRLVGVDGTQFSVLNTPAILAALPKAASRRMEAAFAKLRLVSVVELGTHAPLAALAGPASEGEQQLAAQLWEKVPEGSLVIGDRLFGTGRTLWQATRAWGERDIAVLARVRENIRVEVLRRLPDGSAIVDVPVRDEEDGKQSLRLREIQAQGVGVNGTAFTLRLWTTLVDSERYPAEELARHYIDRWEQELYYRELKLDVRNTRVLASQTPETALQEIAALVLATAVIARMRVETGSQLQVPPRRMSFSKLLRSTEELWAAFRYLEGTLTSTLRDQMWEKYLDDVRRWAVLPERRSRSCPRVLRQPVSKWSRKIDQPSHTGTVTINLVRV
jgi:Transposase DDE domain